MQIYTWCHEITLYVWTSHEALGNFGSFLYTFWLLFSPPYTIQFETCRRKCKYFLGKLSTTLSIQTSWQISFWMEKAKMIHLFKVCSKWLSDFIRTQKLNVALLSPGQLNHAAVIAFHIIKRIISSFCAGAPFGVGRVCCIVQASDRSSLKLLWRTSTITKKYSE